MQRRTLAALIPGAALTAAGVAFAKENDMTTTDLSVTDPDLVAIRERFLKLDVPAHTSALTERERFLVQVTTLTTLSEPLSLKRVVKEALAAGVKPLEIREAVYQPFAYIGFAKVETGVLAMNEAFVEAGVKLPLESATTVTDADRFEKGLTQQKTIFGPAIDTMHKNATDDVRFLQVDALTGWCFGDTYTRKGLTLAEREHLTFVTIATLGGCEPQLRAHTGGNRTMGATKQKLIDTIAAVAGYIGFPRTLNALAIVQEIYKD